MGGPTDGQHNVVTYAEALPSITTETSRTWLIVLGILRQD